MAETVEVCPDCDSATIRKRSLSARGQHATDSRQYHCEDCGHTFDQPTVRPPETNTQGGAESARTAALLAMDPDAAGGDA
ncbi:hypothetical protein ACFQL1_16060 [Halomicroarcula sp. GCM10025709]|uniref:hypothetical protein n=1 Tax=Haloarcula TaxID=2237 RepID=UPI0024C236CB|nr:hypothetical protein [Halomicroarcula sp. YJ-61-S]